MGRQRRSVKWRICQTSLAGAPRNADGRLLRRTLEAGAHPLWIQRIAMGSCAGGPAIALKLGNARRNAQTPSPKPPLPPPTTPPHPPAPAAVEFLDAPVIWRTALARQMGLGRPPIPPQMAPHPRNTRIYCAPTPSLGSFAIPTSSDVGRRAADHSLLSPSERLRSNSPETSPAISSIYQCLADYA